MEASLAIVEQEPSLHPLVVAIAVRMAHEGIPVRAIARATRLVSENVYEVIRDAIMRGSLTEMPPDDWPPKNSRGARNPFQGSLFDDDNQLKLACSRHFKATRLEAAILSVMLRRNEVTKQQLHQVIEQSRPGENRTETDPKMVDVVICHLRKKLKVQNIVIETIWGVGYAISVPDRERAAHMLTMASAEPPQTAVA